MISYQRVLSYVIANISELTTLQSLSTIGTDILSEILSFRSEIFMKNGILRKKFKKLFQIHINKKTTE